MLRIYQIRELAGVKEEVKPRASANLVNLNGRRHQIRLIRVCSRLKLLRLRLRKDLAPVVITTDPAALTRFFQVMAFSLGLPAMFTVSAHCVLQIVFSLSDGAFAPVITVNGVHRDHTACQKERRH